ncbi:MAG: DUF3006 domain-containing protein [Clostridia bacterium]|nr:DUF3006 domain-containing protein [Clostridia bacterium]MBQ7037922.1 DUF3006 domain-containing protein [Clostridia bacterium]
MRYAIDRFEGEQAVLQDDNGICFAVDKALLPSDAVQGDILTRCGEHYCHDREETTARRDRIYRLEQLLRGKRKGKDA